MKQSNKKVTRNEQVNLIDIFYYLLNNWIWFVLCIAVCLVIAYSRYSRMPFSYTSVVTAVLKDPNSGTRSARLDTYDNMINAVSVTHEELQLRSWTLMSEVVKALDADVSYIDHIKFREVELYSSLTPVRILFSRDVDDPGLFDINVTPMDNETLSVDKGGGNVELVALGDTVEVGRGKVVFLPTARYSEEYFNTPIKIRKMAVPEVAVSFVSRLRVSHKDQIITMSLTDPNAQRAADVLNMLIIKYNEDAIREKNKVAVNTANFIEERLRLIEYELGGVENSLADFQSSNRLMDVDEAATRYLSESREYSSEMVSVETRLSLAKYIKDYINQYAGEYQMIPANTGVEDANIEAVIASYNELVLRREKLVAASSLESPAVKQVENTLTTLRHNILGLIANLQSSLEIYHQDLSRREKASIEQYAAMPGKARQMLEIQRQHSIKEELYIFLLNKREENALTQAMADDNIRSIDPAKANYIPSSPQRVKIMLLAFLIGLVLPATVLIARLFLDTKIRTRKEIEENIDVPFLAEIPLNKELRNFIRIAKRRRKGGEEPSPFVYESSSNSVFTEAMRMMCTNLSFLDPDSKPPLVVGMTSYSSASGKTFIVANMAACLADAKKRVIVIDSDMRKRSLSGVLGLKHKTTGLSNYLYDPEMQLGEVLHKDVKPGIDFIPAGSTPPNPGELLARPRFDELISTLRSMYDYILIDGVPVQMLSDPLIVNRVVDCNLFILRSGQLDRRILPQLDELNENRHLSNMAIVFNGPEVKRSRGYGFGSYGYGYGYGYGSGYSYGYGDDEGKNETLINKFFKKRK